MNIIEINALYVTYRRKVYNVALSYVKDTYLAEDLSHEVLMKCYHNREKFNGGSSLDTWIVKVTRNHCIDFLRRSHSRRILLCENINSLGYEDEYTPESEIMSQYKNEELRNKVNQLPEKYRVVIILYYYKNRSLNEIQQILNLKSSTIKARMCRARQRLKAMYQDEGVIIK